MSVCSAVGYGATTTVLLVEPKLLLVEDELLPVDSKLLLVENELLLIDLKLLLVENEPLPIVSKLLLVDQRLWFDGNGLLDGRQRFACMATELWPVTPGLLRGERVTVPPGRRLPSIENDPRCISQKPVRAGPELLLGAQELPLGEKELLLGANGHHFVRTSSWLAHMGFVSSRTSFARAQTLR